MLPTYEGVKSRARKGIKTKQNKTKHKIVHVLFSAMLRLGFPRKTYKNMEVTMLQFSTKVSKHFGKIQDLIVLKHLLGFCLKANPALHSAVFLGEIITGYKKLRGRAHHSFLCFTIPGLMGEPDSFTNAYLL